MTQMARRRNPIVGLFLISGPGFRAVARQLLPAFARATAERRARHYGTGVGETPGILLLRSRQPVKTITLDGQPLTSFEYSKKQNLAWIRFPNAAAPKKLSIQF